MVWVTVIDAPQLLLYVIGFVFYYNIFKDDGDCGDVVVVTVVVLLLKLLPRLLLVVDDSNGGCCY